MEITLPITVGAAVLLGVGALITYFARSLEGRLMHVEAHVAACDDKAKGEAVLSYRVGELERSVRENHLAVMLSLAELAKVKP